MCFAGSHREKRWKYHDPHLVLFPQIWLLHHQLRSQGTVTRFGVLGFAHFSQLLLGWRTGHLTSGMGIGGKSTSGQKLKGAPLVLVGPPNLTRWQLSS